MAGYFFIQWDLDAEDLRPYVATKRAVFLRAALMSFVDYPHDRVLDWSGRSAEISADVRGLIGLLNSRNKPVFLEVNYSDYVPGPIGSGLGSLRATDNAAATVAFLEQLQAEGLHVDGLTYGDEIEDAAGYGPYKPTIYTADLPARFARFSETVKRAFPEIKIYAFDSYVGAARGRVSRYWALLSAIREAETEVGRNLIDGFVFRESYVYMNAAGSVRDSQAILDDPESFYRERPVKRYDTFGRSYSSPDADYLHDLLQHTRRIFGRNLDIGLTEYLPAGPVQISETDTRIYDDSDFIVHFADTVGIYASLGLDFVSTIMFGDSLQMHKAYFDREGDRGTNYPVHEQLARYFTGRLLKVNRTDSYDNRRVKVYPAKDGRRRFIVLLNKDASRSHPISLNLPGRLNLTINLAPRSYNAVMINDGTIYISGIGGCDNPGIE